MMNPAFHLGRMRDLLGEYEPDDERARAESTLDLLAIQLDRCRPSHDALVRDQAASQ